MNWYFPSFCGDFRLESNESDTQSLLTTGDLTPLEASTMVKFLEVASKKEWVAAGVDLPLRGPGAIILHASVAEAGACLAEISGYKTKGKLTVFKSERDELSATELITGSLVPQDTKAAVTVRRPTLCCPSPVQRPEDLRAEHVLEAFLPPEEVDRWHQTRAVRVRGGITGHLYNLAGRDTAQGQKQGRICFDMTDNRILHFHDSLRPPAEEVLAAWLILAFREPWLRNEATCMGARFKNPLGDIRDGTGDAGLSSLAGGFALGFKWQRSLERE